MPIFTAITRVIPALKQSTFTFLSIRERKLDGYESKTNIQERFVDWGSSDLESKGHVFTSVAVIVHWSKDFLQSSELPDHIFFNSIYTGEKEMENNLPLRSELLVAKIHPWILYKSLLKTWNHSFIKAKDYKIATGWCLFRYKHNGVDG